jgi:hypothetical protein
MQREERCEFWQGARTEGSKTMLCTENGFDFAVEDAKALLAFASKDETRPNLCGIGLDATRGHAFGTDGHTLAVATNCGKHDHKAFVVPRAVMEQAVKIAKRGRILISWPTLATKLRLVSTDGMPTPWSDDDEDEDAPRAVNVTCGGTTFRANITNATPPPVEQVVPDRKDESGTSAGRIGANMDYLARLVLVQKAAGVGGMVMQGGKGELDPIRFDVSNCRTGDLGDQTQWVAVIMPMRL